MIKICIWSPLWDASLKESQNKIFSDLILANVRDLLGELGTLDPTCKPTISWKTHPLSK